MRKRDVAMTVALVALFVAAGVAVVVGILTHREAGLMRACVRDDGRFDYDGDCQDVRLEGRGPFLVDIFDDGTPPQEHRDAVASVIRAINTDVGFVLLETDDLEDGLCLDAAAICVHLDEPYERRFMDANGTASHWTTPVGTSCEVRTSNTGTGELRHLVLYHEIGHCLGLAHDDFNSSIMRARQRPTPTGSFPPSLTNHDRDLMRRLYLVQ